MPATETVELDEAEPRRIHGRSRRVLVLGVVTLLVLALGTWLWHWRTHPTVFPGDGGRFTTTLQAGQMLTVGVTYPYPGEGESIVIHAAEPRLVQNSAAASFEFYVCTQAPEQVDGSALGSVIGPQDFDRYCPDPQPVADSTDLDVGATPPQQLVMVVTVTKPGVVAARGVDLTYSHGLRRGTQSVGEHFRLRVA